MSINANGSIRDLRVGSQVIKEARVGATVVYSVGWPAVPADGGIYDYNTGRWGAGIRHSNTGTLNRLLSVNRGTTGSITGVVFAHNTTRLNIQTSQATSYPTILTIDGITMERIADDTNNYHYNIPLSMRTNTPHTITLRNDSTNIYIRTINFNI